MSEKKNSSWQVNSSLQDSLINMEEGTVTKVVNDFLSINDGELSLTKGEIVQIIRIQDRHWCYGCSAGKEGLIPTDFLMEIEIPTLEESQELFASVADFQAQQSGDLYFEKGEIIIGLSPEDDNWWKGKIEDRIGVFPTNYVWKLNSNKFKRSLKLPLSMKALVNTSMKAQLDEEMDLNEGEIITITEVIDKMWYRGICGNREGIFPKNFVVILDENTGSSSDKSIQNAPHPSFASSFDNCASDSTGFSSIPTQENFSSQNQTNSLITFSPEEPKKFCTSTFPSNDLNSLFDDPLNNSFPTLGGKYFSQEYGNNEAYGADADNLGISPYGITLYPFYGQFDNELSFHEGEIVSLLRHIDDDWVEGEIEGRKGIFPVSYVNILIDCVCALEGVNQNTSRINVNDSIRQNTSAKVMHNFHAQMNGDISVKEGEVVYITELVNQDWCRVRNDAGIVGLCPLNYLSPEPASDELNNISFLQNSLPTDGLPNYADLFREQEKNVTLRKPESSKENVSNINMTLISGRPKSIDDMIAKNIATLDFDLKTPNKVSSEVETLPEPRYSLDSAISLHNKNSLSGSSASGVVVTSQNYSINVQEKPKSQPSRPSLPACLIATTSSVHSAEVSRDPENSSLVLQKKYSVSPPIDSEHQKKIVPEILNEDIVFRRQGSYMLPHRPAPPIPVPGQTPVRRTLKRKNYTSTTSSSVKSNLERTSSLSEPKQDEQVEGGIAAAVKEQRLKDSEHRQNVISELVITEKEYVRDLKLTYETFNLHNEEFLESKGIDVQTIFGNIIEVMHVAENLLDKILFSMKNKSDEEQLVGHCFLELADEMRTVYSKYCMNHELALALLEKYESNENIQKIFNKGIETLRYQIACFDMGSILIKPVQRILKYPLMLNELIKCTDDAHKDKPLLLEAVQKMTGVALHINEFKRRKDLVSKYLGDGNETLSNRMSKLSLHSVLKKSSRLGMKLSSSLGISLTTKDPEFDIHELLFRSLEKSIKTFMRNVELFYFGLEEVINCQCACGEIISHCFNECKYKGVVEFRDTQHIIMTKFMSEFKSVIDLRVLKPLNTLIDLFEGPDKLIQKRNDKLLDYNSSLAKTEKNRESRLIHDEILLSKNNYDALNSQLLEELPKLTLIAHEIFLECIAAFISARKLFTGRATKQLLSLCENSLTLSKGNVLEVFSVKHSLVSNKIGRFSFVTKNFSIEAGDKSAENASPILGNKKMCGAEQVSQSNSKRVYLQSRYPSEKLFTVTKSHVPTNTLDLPVNPGNIVAVIKNQDPMGNSNRWFVDAGGSQGFLPSMILEPLYNTKHQSSDDRCKSADSEHIRHSLGSMVLESSNKPLQVKNNRGNRVMNEPVYIPPPAYEEVVETENEESCSTLQRQSTSLNPTNQRYDEPFEDSSFASHVYAEIPDEINSSTEEFYYAMYDFGGSGPHTLPITSGQVLKVQTYHDLLGNPEWWLVKDRNGKSGYVPGNYLKKYD